MFDAREVAQQQAEAAKEFPFVGMDGKTYMLPDVRLMPGEVTERAAMGDTEALYEFIDDEDTIAAMKALPVGVQEALSLEWMQSSDLGKGPGGSSPTRNGGVRSKSTSPRRASTRKS